MSLSGVIVAFTSSLWEVGDVMVVDLELGVRCDSVCDTSETRTADDGYTGVLQVGW